MLCHYGLSSALDILIHLSCSESHLETEFDPIRGMSLKKGGENSGQAVKLR